ncbi:MAG TPA: Rieske 2Fe-2S domain-containing protein [Anaerolineae bacterium]|nr:Rieske 2Fe-2S domain-containing protein [Anaerolineae bacterium]
MWFRQIIDTIDQQQWLDSIAVPLQEAVKKVYAAGGSAGLQVRDFLHGVWLEHPLHPVLTDIPIGAWTAALALDTLEMSSGRKEFGLGADVAVQVGLVGAAGSAVTGLTDWQHTTDRSRRVGMLHALLNSISLLLYLASLILRWRRQRGLGRACAFLGYAFSGAAASLGGDLVYSQQIGVDHAADETPPDKFVPVLPVSDLAEGVLCRVEAEGVPVLLVRRGQQIYALIETCSHLGGPLAEGELEGESVICPWHGSRFALENGQVLDGPSTYIQPVLETRVRNGQIEVRAAKPEAVS